MNRRIAFPFLTLSDSAVSAAPWQASLDGKDWTEAGDYMPDWDPSSTLRFRRVVSLDPVVAASDLSIPSDELRLAVGVRVGTGQGRMSRAIVSRQRHLLEQGNWEKELAFEVPGRDLSLVVDLLTEVTLAASPHRPAALSPRTAGDRLWSDSARARLEGDEPRFPIERADLANLLGEPMAAFSLWHLHWSPRDWGRDFHGAVRLYLNDRMPSFLDRVENEDGDTLQVLLADVMGQICERFILDPEVADLMEGCDPGSLGAQAATWLQKAWPGKDAMYIRAVLEGRPGVFRSAFLALADLGEA